MAPGVAAAEEEVAGGVVGVEQLPLAKLDAMKFRKVSSNCPALPL